MSRPKGERVLLHVYEPAKQTGPSIPGFGVYHTGIELGDNGVEWCFAGGPDAPGSGVQQQRARQTPDASVWKYRETLDLGLTDKTAAQCAAIIRDMQAEYAARDYDVIHNNCLAAGTLVTLADGRSIPIEAVQEGAHVLSYHAAEREGGVGGLVARQVDKWLDQGVTECVELLFDDGRTLVCTPDHRIRTADRRWVEAGTLAVGIDEVATMVADSVKGGGGIGRGRISSARRARGTVHNGAVLPLSHVKLVDRRHVGPRRVYDLSVPSSEGDDTRSFLASGVLVHNCNNFTADVAKRLGLKYPSHINRAATFGSFFMDNPIKDRQRKEAERRAEEERKRNVFANTTGHSLLASSDQAKRGNLSSAAASPTGSAAQASSATAAAAASSSSSSSSSSSAGGARRANPWADPNFFPGKGKPAAAAAGKK